MVVSRMREVAMAHVCLQVRRMKGSNGKKKGDGKSPLDPTGMCQRGLILLYPTCGQSLH